MITINRNDKADNPDHGDGASHKMATNDGGHGSGLGLGVVYGAILAKLVYLGHGMAAKVKRVDDDDDGYDDKLIVLKEGSNPKNSAASVNSISEGDAGAKDNNPETANGKMAPPAGTLEDIKQWMEAKSARDEVQFALLNERMDRHEKILKINDGKNNANEEAAPANNNSDDEKGNRSKNQKNKRKKAARKKRKKNNKGGGSSVVKFDPSRKRWKMSGLALMAIVLIASWLSVTYGLMGSTGDDVGTASPPSLRVRDNQSPPRRVENDGDVDAGKRTKEEAVERVTMESKSDASDSYQTIEATNSAKTAATANEMHQDDSTKGNAPQLHPQKNRISYFQPRPTWRPTTQDPTWPPNTPWPTHSPITDNPNATPTPTWSPRTGSPTWHWTAYPTTTKPTISPTSSSPPTSSSSPSAPPTNSQLPSDSPSSSIVPTASDKPSNSPTDSVRPTQSALPSNIPSSLPTFEGGCMNLTMALLMPKVTRGYYYFAWEIKTASEGRSVSWTMAEDPGLGYDWDDVGHRYQIIDASTSNTIIVEHSNGPNSSSRSICLPMGETYTLRVKMSTTDADHIHGSGVGYTLSSEGQQLKYGIIPFKEEENKFGSLDKGIDDEITFKANSSESYNAVDASCRIPSFYGNGQTGHGFELSPLQCYYSTFERDDYFEMVINRAKWESEECSHVLAEACRTDDFLGFGNSSMADDVEDFCVYMNCADGSHYEQYYEQYEADNNWYDDLVYDQPGFQGDLEKARDTCGCRFEHWDCKHGSEECINDACCSSNTVDPYGKRSSCECFVQPSCEVDGDPDRCTSYAEKCCGDDECECEYKTRACREAQKETFDYSDTEICWDAYVQCCPVSEYFEVGGCKCDFLEPLCNEFPNNDIFCDATFGYCCSEDNYHCQCDFRNHAVNNLGMDTEKGGSLLGVSFCGAADRITSNSADVEMESLKSIYNKTGGDYWLNKKGWMTKPSPCDWYGIACDSEDHVTELRLGQNNVEGVFPATLLSNFYKLKALDLSGNKLWGTMAGTSIYSSDVVNDTSLFFNLRELTYIDLSQNNLSGEVDVLFAPALEHADFSHNNFTSLDSFKQFKLSFHTLRTCDLSHNSIKQKASDIMKNIPPSIEQYIFSSNDIQGKIPSSLEDLPNLRHFSMGSNQLSGELPDFSSSFPNLQTLNLSNQKSQESSGLTGIIPARLSNLPFLRSLDLAGNSLIGSIPPSLGNVAQLKTLNISNNMLSESIPEEMGKLAGTSEMLDLSNNKLEGEIPLGLGQFGRAFVLLDGNANMSTPAPLSLCFVKRFDLQNDAAFCPTERNSLKDFYDSTKGREWTKDTNWVDERLSHCSWHGVICDNATNTTTIGLNLTNNGLSGTLSTSIGNLSSISVLDVSDNDIKGPIPTEIGLLFDLTSLRIAYNSFTGTVPKELTNLMQLTMFQLHNNRIVGTIPHLKITADGSSKKSSFVADCGMPTAFGDPLICKSCTMCCNSQGDCEDNTKTRIQKIGMKGFENYRDFTWIVFLSVFVFCCTVYLSSYLYDKHKKHKLQTFVGTRRQSAIIRDIAYAMDTIGNDSVYQFFLSKSLLGWAIALATMVIQIWVLFIFVIGSEFEPTDDISDFVYTWKCPRDEVGCEDKTDLTGQGWALFGILMAAHLLKDLISGTKMIILSTKKQYHLHTRMRCFIGGMLLSAVTAFTLYTSAIYNKAIATSNTEIIANSVIILFITDVDELVYGILMLINKCWVEGLTQQEEVQGPATMNHEGSHGPEMSNGVSQDEVDNLKKEVETLRKAVAQLMRQQTMVGTKVPQDVHESHPSTGSGIGLSSASQRLSAQQPSSAPPMDVPQDGDEGELSTGSAGNASSASQRLSAQRSSSQSSIFFW